MKTYSVVVRDQNSWDSATGICTEIRNCGHKHRSEEAADKCMERLTAWWCLCGRTKQSFAPCCGTPRNGTSAAWYHARVEVNA